MDSTRINPILDAKYAAFQANGISVSSPVSVKSWIASARSSILSQLAAVNASSFTAAGPTISANNLVTVTGLAPVEIKTIRVNGVAYPVTWGTITGWSMDVPLNAAVNTLSLQAFDVRGNLLSNYNATVTVNYTGAIQRPQDDLVINEVMYAPAISGAEFVELYNNSPE